jgi:hypothetical protein
MTLRDQSELFETLAAFSVDLLRAATVSPDDVINHFTESRDSPGDVVEFTFKVLNEVLSKCQNCRLVAELFFFHYLHDNHPSNQLCVTITADHATINQGIAELVDQNPGLVERLPKLLLVHLPRTMNGADAVSQQINRRCLHRTDSNLLVGKTHYMLYAVVEHLGLSAEDGHFMTYIRDSDGWLLCNDSQVSETTESRVFASSQTPNRSVCLVAFVQSITDVRTSPRTGLRIGSCLCARTRLQPGTVVVTFFDAATMTIERSVRVVDGSAAVPVCCVKEPSADGTVERPQTVIVNDSIAAAMCCLNELAANLLACHGNTLRSRYRVNMTPLFDNPPYSFDANNETLICWVERRSMRLFNPATIDRCDLSLFRLSATLGVQSTSVGSTL